jgi:NitT/TauT family transport system permease protein
VQDDSARAAVWIHAPETFVVFGIFYSWMQTLRAPPTPDSAPRLLNQPRRFFMLRRILPVTLSIGFALLAWHLTVQVTGLPRFILPAPADVWFRFLRALDDGSLLRHTSVTMLEILLGLLAGVIFATVMGYSLAKSRTLEKVLSPYLVASQAIPIIAIAPLLVIWLGPGILSKVVICALIVFFPVLVNTIVGIRAVPHALYDMMNSLHATRWQIVLKLELPASLPVLLGGLRIGATLSVIGAIVGELVDANQGLGFLLRLGDFQYDTPMVFVAVFTLIALALMLYGSVRLLENRFLKWQEASHA